MGYPTHPLDYVIFEWFLVSFTKTFLLTLHELLLAANALCEWTLRPWKSQFCLSCLSCWQVAYSLRNLDELKKKKDPSFDNFANLLALNQQENFNEWFYKIICDFFFFWLILRSLQPSYYNFNPIHHDIFSDWFIMSELIIYSIWIIDMTNSLFPWSSGRPLGFTLQFYWFQVQIPIETAIFYVIFFWGIFWQFKVPGSSSC